MDLTADPPLSEETDSALALTLEGFEGPIDLLLTLAREQKFDLATVSIAALAEQYLAFIAAAKHLRLDIAGDYLVMAAWLAYLKSRLLVPEPPTTDDDPLAPEAMAEALKEHIRQLEAIQRAAQRLQDLPRLGHEVFLRGAPENLAVEERPVYFLPLYDLLTAVAAPERRKRHTQRYAVPRLALYSLEESVARLRLFLPGLPDWTTLSDFLPEDIPSPSATTARSALASTFAATLELVKEGALDVRQEAAFGPLWIRRRSAPLSDAGDEGHSLASLPPDSPAGSP